jgi:rhodanese-related sulfurtransferase
MTTPPTIPTVDVTEAERRSREDPTGAILLDVREVSEFHAVRAPSAALMPTSVFMARVAELPVDRTLLVVCRTGARSAAVTNYLLRTGRTDVFNVGGGMEAWERAGLPVRRGRPDQGEGELPAG